MALKEWKETTRDRLFLLLAFLLPALWLVVFGYGLNLDVENIPFAVLDRDRSELSRDYPHRFMQSRYFAFQGYADDERALDRLLTETKIRAAIIVPERFQEQLAAGEPASVQTFARRDLSAPYGYRQRLCHCHQPGVHRGATDRVPAPNPWSHPGAPRMPIRPGITRVRTRLTSVPGRVLLANSITLTPGTMSVDLVGDVLYVTTWETVRIEPWLADNMYDTVVENYEGWQTLVVQAMNGKVRYFINGTWVAEHSGNYYPDSPMSINFNLWFINGGLINSRELRFYQEDLDWVFHEAGVLLSPEQVNEKVQALREAGTRFVDTVPAGTPVLESLCDL